MERPGEENKLFVGCLPADISEEDLRTVFGTYGEVSNVHLMNSKISERGHACAFVSYTRAESGEDAIAVLDGKYKIRDTPDAEFLKVAWKKQGDRSSGKGGDKGGGWNGGQQGGSSWSGGQQDSWKPNPWGGAPSNNSGWNSQPPANQWGSPPNSSWSSSPPSQPWNAGGGKGWDAGKNSWQDSSSWGGKGKGGSDWGQKGYSKGGNDYGQGGGMGNSWGQGGQDWKGGGGKSAPEPTNRLFIGNLPSDIGEESLQYVFSTYGKVGSVHIMAGKSKSGQSCAFVEYATVEEAETAIATLHEKYEIRPGDGPILVKFGNAKGGGKGKSSPY